MSATYTLRSRVNLRTPVRASLLFTLSTGAARGIAFLTTAWFTRQMSPEAFGLYPLYTATLGLVSVLGTWGLHGGLLYRRMVNTPPAKRAQTVAEQLCLVLVPYTVTAVALTLLATLAPARLPLPPAWLAVLLWQLLCGTVLAFYFATCRFTYHARAFATLTLVNAVLTPALTACLLLHTPLGGLARILAPAIVETGAAAYAAVRLLKGVVRPCKLPWRVLREGASLLPYSLALVGVEEGVRLLLGARIGAAALAKFGIAMAVGTAPQLITSGVNAVLQPWMLRKLSAAQTPRVRDVLTRVSICIGGLSVALTWLSPELFAFLAPASYRDARPYVVPIALSVLPHLLFLSLTAISLYRARTRQVTCTTVLAALVGLCACVALLQSFGTAGAAWSVPLSYTLLALSAYLPLRRSEDAAALPHAAHLLLVLLVGLMLSLLSLPLMPYPLPRLLLCAALLVALALYILRARHLLCEP